MSARPTPTPDAPAMMSEEEVDAVLAGLAALVPQLIDDHRAAEAEAERWCAAEEAYLVAPDRSPRCLPDPERAIATVRAEMTAATVAATWQAARGMTAWWADVATYALAAAVLDRPVPRAFVTVADPSAYLEDSDFRALPEPPEHVLTLAGLGARMGGREMLRGAQELVEGWGMTLRHSADGGPQVVDDEFADGRRRRVWGQLWTHYRLPALAGADELADMLTGHGAPAHIVDDVRAAREAVQEVVRAEFIIDPPEDPGSDDAAPVETARPDRDALERADACARQAPEVLSGYARTLTAHLGELRTERPR